MSFAPATTTAEDLEAFRSEFRGWLDENLPMEWRDLSRGVPEQKLVPIRREWGRRLAANGWLGIRWPKAYGGRELSLDHEVTIIEAQVEVGAPEPLNSNGIQIFGPLLLRHGTEEQRARFLRPLLAHEEIWCQGFSEPEAGSDLANLSTQATRDGDGWHINGQKVWTTYGHEADWCYVLTRTQPRGEPKQQGMSLLAVDMHQPGVTFQPLMNIAGSYEFNEIFFRDARADGNHLIGEEGRGWSIATEALAYERGLSFAQRAMRLIREFALVSDLARQTGSASHDLITAFASTRAMRALILEILERSSRGEELGSLASIAKVYWSECHQDLLKLATEIAGAGITQLPLHDLLGARLAARGETIYGGTSEIQRNLIARSLGLPSDRARA